MNAPSTIESAMSIILSPVEWRFARAYLHNIALYLRSSRDDFENLQKESSPSYEMQKLP